MASGALHPVKKIEGANGVAIPWPPPYTGSLLSLSLGFLMCEMGAKQQLHHPICPRGRGVPCSVLTPHGRADPPWGRERGCEMERGHLRLPSGSLVFPTALSAARGEDHTHPSSCQPTALPSLARGRPLAHLWFKGCPKFQASPVLGLRDLNASTLAPTRAEREATVQVGKPRPREVLPKVPKVKGRVTQGQEAGCWSRIKRGRVPLHLLQHRKGHPRSPAPALTLSPVLSSAGRWGQTGKQPTFLSSTGLL